MHGVPTNYPCVTKGVNMDFIYILRFLENYSVPTLVISVIVSVLTYLIKRYLIKKTSAIKICYLPFLLGILLYFAFYLIFMFDKFQTSLEEIVYSGIVCGALSVAISMTAINLVQGKKDRNLVVSAIKGTLLEFVETVDEKVVKSVEIVITRGGSADEIVEELKKLFDDSVSEEQLNFIADLILTTVNSLKTR